MLVQTTHRPVNALKRRPLVPSAFILAAVFAGLFAVRSGMFMVNWADPAHRDQIIAAWMTPRYVSLSWHLPPKVLFEAMQTKDLTGKRRVLGEIADDMGISFEELEKRILAETIHIGIPKNDCHPDGTCAQQLGCF